MKYKREIKVALLVIVCGFLVYFGLNFLKGIDIFSPVKHYVGVFDNIRGLTEQAPVYVRGCKVGQVDKITYDFTQEKAFVVTVSLDQNITVTEPAEMRLVDDGLLNGKAIEVVVPIGDIEGQHIYASGDTLPTIVVEGLLETLQEGFVAKLDNAIENIDSLIVKVNTQIDEDALKITLENLERVSANLDASARVIKEVTDKQLPNIILNADTMISDAKLVVHDIKQVDMPATVARVDQVVDTLQNFLTSQDGTIGKLLNDNELYNHIDSAVVSVDSLVSDIKVNPKRYVRFSIFGGKDKNNTMKTK